MLINGIAGAVWAPGGKPRVVFCFTIEGGKITRIDMLTDPELLGELDLAVLTRAARQRDTGSEIRAAGMCRATASCDTWSRGRAKLIPMRGRARHE